ncbi:uncharacterized protein LOC133888158 [Phragmites australis]|uniref:uncharacterized protein LOC133888158 n=1 Tax=Phragmites australis TaxID=29695 RepID=UPI002D7A1ECB|nr:uncharacterized protein LOC133888158 [Phragmites australis]
MEEVTVLPVVTTVVDENNEIPSVSVEEAKEQIHGDVARITAAVNNEELSVESTNGADDKMAECSTPITRIASCRPAGKKRSAFGLFRAMFLSFGGSGSGSMKKRDDATCQQKKASVGDDNDRLPAASWKTLVDGMRPLRLRGQELEYYPPPPPLGHADVYHDVLLAPPSPARSGSDEGGMTSRYASAQDLYLLDSGEEESAPAVEGGDGGSCPHAIDMQAEEFIAKFYEQFRLQKSESFNGRATE